MIEMENNRINRRERRNYEIEKREKNFSKILAYNKESMEAMGLVRYNEDTDGRAFVNMSKLTMLLTSTIVQLGIQMRDAQQSFNDRIESLENKMLQQGGS